MPPRHQRQSAYVSGRARHAHRQRTRVRCPLCLLGKPGNRCLGLGNTTAGEHDGPAACGRETKACRGRRGVCGQGDAPSPARCSTGPVWCGPMFHRSGLVRPDVPPDRGRSGPGPAPGGERADAVSRSSLMPEMVNRHRRWHERSQADRDSMVSRRTQPFQAWDAARGRTTSAQRPHGRAFHAASKVPQPHPHLLAHLFQMNGFTWGVFGESAGINRHGGGDGRALR
jgi:hypothetical protein